MVLILDINKSIASNSESNASTKDKNRKANLLSMLTKTKNVTLEQEKIAVVTGSSSGIGYETALPLLHMPQ